MTELRLMTDNAPPEEERGVEMTFSEAVAEVEALADPMAALRFVRERVAECETFDDPGARDMLFDKIRSRFKECKPKILRDAYDQVKTSPPPEEVDSEDPDNASAIAEAVEDLNARFAYVGHGDGFVVIRDDGSNLKYMKRSAISGWYENKPVSLRDSDGDTVLVNPVKLWMSSPDRREFEDSDFFPGEDAEVDGGAKGALSRATRGGVYNLWRGFNVTPVEGDWGLLMDHMFTNICRCDHERFEWLLGWMAQLVQGPAEKMGSAVVMRGGRGVGKTKVAEWLSYLLEPHAMSVSQPEQVTGKFNAHQATALLVVAEEAFWAGDKKNEGALKHLISSKKLTIEPKGIDPKPLDNYLRIMAISNEDWVVPAGFDERRFFVLDVGTAQQKNTTYFGAIDEQMRNGGAEAMLYDLLRYDLRGLDIRNPPVTGALRDQVSRSLRPHEEWWLDVLESGHLSVNVRWNDPIAVSRGELYDSYCAHTQGRRTVQLSRNAVFKFIRNSVKDLGEDKPMARDRRFLLPGREVAYEEFVRTRPLLLDDDDAADPFIAFYRRVGSGRTLPYYPTDSEEVVY